MASSDLKSLRARIERINAAAAEAKLLREGVEDPEQITQEQFNVYTPEQRQKFILAGVKQFKPSIKVK